MLKRLWNLIFGRRVRVVENLPPIIALSLTQSPDGQLRNEIIWESPPCQHFSPLAPPFDLAQFGMPASLVDGSDTNYNSSVEEFNRQFMERLK